jgi:hypothetical protein
MTNTHTPPAAPQARDIPPLPESKRNSLAQDVGIYMQQGLDRFMKANPEASQDAINRHMQELLATRAMEYMALAKVLKPGSHFAEHVSEALTKQINAALADPSLHVKEKEVGVGVDNMLIKRSAEAEQSGYLVCDPEFIADLPNAVRSMVFGTLSDKKIEEIAQRLAQPNDPNGVDAPIHITGSAIGAQLLHNAMIDVYDPVKGPLVKPLLKALHDTLPDMPEERRQIVARGWLQDRYHAAISVTQAVAPDSIARQSAVTLADEVIKAAYRPSHAETTPKALDAPAAPGKEIQAEDTVQAGTVAPATKGKEVM